jgi:protein-S-isoprenylcysteine O-methyltransferase Ste14
MTIVRGLIFTALVPFVVAFYAPSRLARLAQAKGGLWDLGWLPIAAGIAIYALCLLRFLAAGGTPAIFFTRPLRFLIGEEPRGLVLAGPYCFSRNPMYVGVLLVIFGQALIFASPRLAIYGFAVFACFHLVVVLIEEPHLRETRGESYASYIREVPRWLGISLIGGRRLRNRAAAGTGGSRRGGSAT